MRRKKSEEIRRLILAAASMCDLSSLKEVRKKLTAAAKELEALDSERTSKKKLIEPEKNKFVNVNPLDKIRAIENEIRKEKEKISRDEGFELLNG